MCDWNQITFGYAQTVHGSAASFGFHHLLCTFEHSSGNMKTESIVIGRWLSDEYRSILSLWSSEMIQQSWNKPLLPTMILDNHNWATADIIHTKYKSAQENNKRGTQWLQFSLRRPTGMTTEWGQSNRPYMAYIRAFRLVWQLRGEVLAAYLRNKALLSGMITNGKYFFSTFFSISSFEVEAGSISDTGHHITRATLRSFVSPRWLHRRSEHIPYRR